MGGFVVQKYLESRDAPGRCPDRLSTATLPAEFAAAVDARSLRRHLWRPTKFALTGSPAHLYGSLAGARELFLGARASDCLVNWTATRLLFDMVADDPVNTLKTSTPMRVMGGANERIQSTNCVLLQRGYSHFLWLSQHSTTSR